MQRNFTEVVPQLTLTARARVCVCVWQHCLPCQPGVALYCPLLGRQLYNEAKCTEMLTLGKNVEALGEKLQGLTSQCNIFTQALQAVEEQKKEEEASKQKAEAVAKAQQAAREAQAAKEAKEAADKAEAERVAKEQALKAAADAKAAAEAEAAKLKAVAAAKAESDAMEIETAATKAAAEAAEQMQIEADAAPKGFALVVKLVSSGGKNQLDIVVPDSGVTIADVKKEIERLQPDCPAGRQVKACCHDQGCTIPICLLGCETVRACVYSCTRACVVVVVPYAYVSHSTIRRGCALA